MSKKTRRSFGFLSKVMFWKKKSKKTKAEQIDIEGAPRITSDTVAEHREQILAGARRFIYPLQQSKHRVVIISGLIVGLLLIMSTVFTSLLLYRYQSTGDFAYQVSKLIPFPVAKVNGDYVSYEDYLFEVRYAEHYLRTNDQEGIDIQSEEGKRILNQYKRQALEKVKLDAIAAQIAAENGIKITDEDVERAIDSTRAQGGIGNSDQVLADILRTTYDWTIEDLRKSIRLQLVRQSLPRLLDTETIERAESVMAKLGSGDAFTDLAKEYSDDTLTKQEGGLIGLISRTNTDLPPEFIEAAFSLEAGETSELVESRFGLHIIHIGKVRGDEREVSHILFSYFDIDTFLKERLAQVEVVDYITIETIKAE